MIIKWTISLVPGESQGPGEPKGEASDHDWSRVASLTRTQSRYKSMFSNRRSARNDIWADWIGEGGMLDSGIEGHVTDWHGCETEAFSEKHS